MAGRFAPTAAHRPGLSPRAHQRHPRAAGRLPGAHRGLCRPRRLRRQHVPLQDSAQEGVLRAADGRAISATCSPPDERAIAARHIPWTRLVKEGHDDAKRQAPRPHPTHQDRTARPGAEAERRLRRPRRDAGMGGRRERVGRDAVEGAERPRRAWVVQEKIHVRRELFPRFAPGRARASATCSWTARRICFAGSWPAS